jgi:type II secretion system protein J
MTMRSSMRHYRSGFTLLELLVATAVAAVVLLVINGTFFGALRLHNTAHARIDEDLALQRALAIIRQDLSGLMIPPSPTSQAVVLSGQLQTIVSSTSASDPVGERVSPDIYTNSGKISGWDQYADVQKVSYFLSPPTDSSNAKTLIRAVTRNLLPVQDVVAPEQQELLPGVSAVTVEFYDGTDWTTEWDSSTTGTLPTAVRFSVTLVRSGLNGNNTSAPITLVVPVLVSTSAAQQQAAATAAGGQE